MLLEDVGRHRIGKRHDDAGDDEQEGPQDDLELHQEHTQHLVQVIRHRDVGHVAGHAVVPALIEQPVGVGKADEHRAEDEEAQQKTRAAASQSQAHIELGVGDGLSLEKGGDLRRSGADDGDEDIDQRRDDGRRPVAAQAVQRGVLVFLIRFHDGKGLIHTNIIIF